MKKAMKKEGQIVTAYQLGVDSPKIRALLAEGKIKNNGKGSYEIFSQEAANGKGEAAQSGDYIKVDSRGFPYPNDKSFFEENHKKVGENLYEQIPKPLDAWTVQEETCEEIMYLMEKGLLTIHEDNPKRYFNAQIWGSELSAPKDAVLMLYRVDRDKEGSIADIDFNFVERSEFERTYNYI